MLLLEAQCSEGQLASQFVAAQVGLYMKTAEYQPMPPSEQPKAAAPAATPESLHSIVKWVARQI